MHLGPSGAWRPGGATENSRHIVIRSRPSGAPAGARCLPCAFIRGLAALTPGYVSSAPPGPCASPTMHLGPSGAWRPGGATENSRHIVIRSRPSGAPAGARCLPCAFIRGLAALTPGYVSSAPPGPCASPTMHLGPSGAWRPGGATENSRHIAHPLTPVWRPCRGAVSSLRIHPGARCAHPRLRLFGPSGALCLAHNASRTIGSLAPRRGHRK